MADTDRTDDRDVFRELAAQMAEAERQRDAAVLERILDDSLRFRRASGKVVDKKVVDKEEYLRDLLDPVNRYECLESEVEDVTVYENLAIVVLVVRARMIRGKDRVEGTYRNVRIFTKATTDGSDEWHCTMWLNMQIGDIGC